LPTAPSYKYFTSSIGKQPEVKNRKEVVKIQPGTSITKSLDGLADIIAKGISKNLKPDVISAEGLCARKEGTLGERFFKQKCCSRSVNQLKRRWKMLKREERKKWFLCVLSYRQKCRTNQQVFR